MISAFYAAYLAKANDKGFLLQRNIDWWISSARSFMIQRSNQVHELCRMSQDQETRHNALNESLRGEQYNRLGLTLTRCMHTTGTKNEFNATGARARHMPHRTFGEALTRLEGSPFAHNNRLKAPGRPNRVRQSVIFTFIVALAYHMTLLLLENTLKITLRQVVLSRVAVQRSKTEQNRNS